MQLADFLSCQSQIDFPLWTHPLFRKREAWTPRLLTEPLHPGLSFLWKCPEAILLGLPEQFILRTTQPVRC